jgi:D-galactarolactone cycloisomerase
LRQTSDKNTVITRISVQVYRIPIVSPVTTSFGSMTSRPAVFVRIEDEDGVFGWGEIFANWPAAGAEHRARLLLEDVADLVLGKPFSHRVSLFWELEKATHIRALQCGEWGPFNHVIAGLDIAFHDLLARKAGVPLRIMLNPDAPDKVPTYASGIHINNAEATIAKCRDQGFQAFKVKVGFDLTSEIGRIHEVYAELQGGERLFADANQAWDANEAIEFLNGVSDIDLGWLEEPIPADSTLDDWRKVASSSNTPIAGGENIARVQPFTDAIQSSVFGVVQPDIAKWGGFTGCLSVIQTIKKHNLLYCPHFLGGGIGLTASAHLLAAVGGDGLLEVDVNPNSLRELVGASVQQRDRGQMSMGNEPGLGIVDIPEELSRFLTLSRELAF